MKKINHLVLLTKYCACLVALSALLPYSKVVAAENIGINMPPDTSKGGNAGSVEEPIELNNPNDTEQKIKKAEKAFSEGAKELQTNITEKIKSAVYANCLTPDDIEKNPLFSIIQQLIDYYRSQYIDSANEVDKTNALWATSRYYFHKVNDITKFGDWVGPKYKGDEKEQEIGIEKANEFRCIGKDVMDIILSWFYIDVMEGVSSLGELKNNNHLLRAFLSLLPKYSENYEKTAYKNGLLCRYMLIDELLGTNLCNLAINGLCFDNEEMKILHEYITTEIKTKYTNYSEYIKSLFKACQVKQVAGKVMEKIKAYWARPKEKNTRYTDYLKELVDSIADVRKELKDDKELDELKIKVWEKQNEYLDLLLKEKKGKELLKTMEKTQVKRFIESTFDGTLLYNENRNILEYASECYDIKYVQGEEVKGYGENLLADKMKEILLTTPIEPVKVVNDEHRRRIETTMEKGESYLFYEIFKEESEKEDKKLAGKQVSTKFVNYDGKKHDVGLVDAKTKKNVYGECLKTESEIPVLASNLKFKENNIPEGAEMNIALIFCDDEGNVYKKVIKTEDEKEKEKEENKYDAKTYAIRDIVLAEIDRKYWSVQMGEKFSRLKDIPKRTEECREAAALMYGNSKMIPIEEFTEEVSYDDFCDFRSDAGSCEFIEKISNTEKLRESLLHKKQENEENENEIIKLNKEKRQIIEEYESKIKEKELEAAEVNGDDIKGMFERIEEKEKFNKIQKALKSEQEKNTKLTNELANVKEKYKESEENLKKCNTNNELLSKGYSELEDKVLKYETELEKCRKESENYDKDQEEKEKLKKEIEELKKIKNNLRDEVGVFLNTRYDMGTGNDLFEVNKENINNIKIKNWIKDAFEQLLATKRFEVNGYDALKIELNKNELELVTEDTELNSYNQLLRVITKDIVNKYGKLPVNEVLNKCAFELCTLNTNEKNAEPEKIKGEKNETYKEYIDRIKKDASTYKSMVYCLFLK